MVYARLDKQTSRNSLSFVESHCEVKFLNRKIENSTIWRKKTLCSTWTKSKWKIFYCVVKLISWKLRLESNELDFSDKYTNCSRESVLWKQKWSKLGATAENVRSYEFEWSRIQTSTTNSGTKNRRRRRELSKVVQKLIHLTMALLWSQKFSNMRPWCIKFITQFVLFILFLGPVSCYDFFLLPISNFPLAE